MKIKHKLITFILTFAIVLSFIPALSAQAATNDFNIISENKVTVNQARKWAKSKGATDTFISLADLYFKYSSEHGDVNAAIAYVQAAKETGFGNFGGVLDASYHNPCGLKNSSGGDDTDKDAHEKFKSWDEGVQAHLDHLALYAGASGYPRSSTNDPRHFVTIKGRATTVNSLGGKWAPSATYGEEVRKLYENLLDYAGVDYPKDTSDQSNNNANSLGSNGSNSGSATTNEKKVIVIDPGHDYGSDYGAESAINGVTYSETELNLQVAVKLKSELEKRGYNAIMTRSEGQTPAYDSLTASLEHRVNVANQTNADFFISIHHNCASETATGVETYYSVQSKDDAYGGGLDSDRVEKSKNMALLINNSIVNKIGAVDRGYKSDASSNVGSLFILRNANMPADLVEVGFITNAEEAKRCADSANQQLVAEAIAEVIAANV